MRTNYLFILLFTMVFSVDVYSGVKPVHTREIIGLSKEYKVDIVNTSNEKYLVQSWLEDLSGNASDIPVVLTPPIFEIPALGSGLVRLMPLTKRLAKDRESVYWLNIQEIPKKSESHSGNQLKMAVRTRIKVFVRPQFMSNDGLESASESLIWSSDTSGGNRLLLATNNTPYYLSLGELMVEANGVSERLPDRFNMVPPFATQRYQLPSDFANKELLVKHGVINDYGGVNVIHKTKVK